MQLTRQLAVELAPWRIRVNSVAPGWIDTPLTTSYVESAVDPAAAHQSIVNASPLGAAIGRMGTAAEVASAVAYLASDDAGFITGANLTIDGGYSVQ